MTATTRRPTRRASRCATVLAVPTAVAVSGLLVSQASWSAYSATTESPTSSWATGTVALSDDDNGTAAFTAANLRPGAAGVRCIRVTSTGSLASDVRLYATGLSSTQDLARHLTLTITQGTGGGAGLCAGFAAQPGGGRLFTGTVAGFAASSTGYGDGLAGWSPTGAEDETRTYRIAYGVSADAPDTTQGGTASVGFTWEARNR
jgi:hypothetical protein